MFIGAGDSCPFESVVHFVVDFEMTSPAQQVSARALYNVASVLKNIYNIHQISKNLLRSAARLKSAVIFDSENFSPAALLRLLGALDKVIAAALSVFPGFSDNHRLRMRFPAAAFVSFCWIESDDLSECLVATTLLTICPLQSCDVTTMELVLRECHVVAANELAFVKYFFTTANLFSCVERGFPATVVSSVSVMQNSVAAKCFSSAKIIL